MLVELFQQAVRELCEACKDVYGDNLVSVAVFGSVGRGTPSPESDIDLLVVARNLSAGRVNRIGQFAAVEKKVSGQLQTLKASGISTCLSPVLKTPEEVKAGSLLFLDMIADAVILYDKDNFFADFLQDFSLRLTRMGAQKIYLRGRWHWLLKSEYRQGEVFEI